MNKKAFCNQGSLYLGVTLLLLFLTVFMGIVLNQALLFSSLVRKKQEYAAQFYAVDALVEYGVAYALDNYADLCSEQTSDGVNGKNMRLVFDHWPEQEVQTRYSGIIAITKKENGGLDVQATLRAGMVSVQRVSCVVQKMLAQESGQSFLRIVNWRRK